MLKLVKRGLTAFIFISVPLIIFFSKPVYAGLDKLTITWSPTGTNTLSWEAVVPSTTNAKVTYYVFRRFGQVAISVTLVGPPPTSSNATLIGSIRDKTSFQDNSGAGSWSYRVVAWDDGGGVVPTAFVDTSATVVSRYIHYSNTFPQGVGFTRADSNGQQLGKGRQWTFGYKLMADSYLDVGIYEPQTTFNTDANGFVTTIATGGLIKTIVNYNDKYSAARSGEMADGSWTNQEFWDVSNSSGAVVPNGIYIVLFRAYDAYGTVRGTELSAVPVDILRFMDLSATGISPSSDLANINYTFTGEGYVRILIAKPGTQFTFNQTLIAAATGYLAGEAWPLNDAGTAVDLTKVVKIFTFYRHSGTYVETWDGHNEAGAAVVNGVYPCIVSARDDFGNVALGTNGNDWPILVSIPVEKTPPQTTAGDTTAPSVVSVTPAAGSIVTAPVSQISVTLADSGGSGLDLTNTTVSAYDPNSNPIAATKSTSGTDTIILTITTPLTTNGNYTIRCTPRDLAGNQASDYTSIFSLSITVAGVETSFKDSVYAYPNPAKSVPASIAFRLISASKITVEIFNILGDRVWKQEFNSAAGNQIYTWNLINDDNEKIGSGVYIYRLKADDGISNFEVTKKLIVIQ